VASTTHAHRSRRTPLIIVAVLLAALLPAGLWLLIRTAHSVNKPISLGGVNWIMYREDLISMQAADLGVFQPILSGPHTFMLEHSTTGNAPPGAAGSSALSSALRPGRAEQRLPGDSDPRT
jgi:hypothetical protein